MCGRFTLVAEPEAVMERFGVDEIPFTLSKRFNIAPTQQIAVVQEINGIRTVAQMRWGLIPFFAKDMKMGVCMINARAETILEKTSFKRLVSNKRIVVISDGFYEWRQSEDRQKQPLRIMRKDGELIGMTGYIIVGNLLLEKSYTAARPLQSSQTNLCSRSTIECQLF